MFNCLRAFHASMDAILELMAFCLGRYLDGLFGLKRVKSPG